MINIYRSKDYDCEINYFHGRDWVERNEVVIKTKKVFGKDYTYAEPATPGNYAFGGTILFTSNGIYPEFNEPIKLHDRQMNLEVQSRY
jgi:hypothetical protein